MGVGRSTEVNKTRKRQSFYFPQFTDGESGKGKFTYFGWLCTRIRDTNHLITSFSCQSFLVIPHQPFLLVLDQFSLKMKMSEQAENLLIH